MKRLLAWITILCILLGHVSPISTALAMDDEARDVAMSENETDAANFTKTIVAGDGSTYEIRVTYNGEIGIPAEGTELVVKELLPCDAEYDYYIAESAAKLNKTTDELTYSRLFDIKIVDTNDPEKVYEPTGDVSVSIRLVGEQLSEYDNVDVLHFTENEAKKSCTVETMEPSVEGESLEFTTDSFSVYVVIAHEDTTDVTVVTPRVEFHFIADGATEYPGVPYYAGDPYLFRNKSANGDEQSTQILSNGESLELITDPGNTDTEYFYGWYMVSPYTSGVPTDEYGIGTDGKLYYTWTDMPLAISFEHPISITESNVAVGDTVHWSMNGVSGSGTVDADGNVHVFLAPVFKKYSFINFMLRPKSDSSNNVMARKLVAKGSAENIKVKISDIRSNSTDPVHLIFTGWEYEVNGEWIQVMTVDYTGAELTDPNEDGVYRRFSVNDEQSIDLYPIFIEARWVDFVSGASGSGATYVASRFLESWGNATPAGTEEKKDINVFLSDSTGSALKTSTRAGYGFDGWYAFAVTDPDTGEITNLDTPADVTVQYVDTNDNHTVHSVTINTTAIKISDDVGNILFSGDYKINIGGNEICLFSASAGVLKLHDALDRLTLYANWTPGSSQITVVYWVENVQDKDYVPSNKVDDTYSIGLAKIYSTDELNDMLYAINGTRPFKSGYSITYSELDTLGFLTTDKLTGAVLPGEEKFFEVVPTTRVIGKDESENPAVDIHPDSAVTIKGDGSSVFNVYFDRMTFKLVFHIGRDGHVKNGGHQKNKEYEYPNWDGNWIEFMYLDDDVSALGYPKTPKPNPAPSPAASIDGTFSMTYTDPNPPHASVTYDSNYATTNANVMGDYVPGDNENVYVITAKYGAYIGDKWPSHSNPNFTFTDASGKNKTLYIWAAYYGSRYAYIANMRDNSVNTQGNNPDINGVYEYMSAELVSDRSGTGLINDNHVHHLVAYFGNANNNNRYKQYHIVIEAIDGTYDPNVYTPVSSGYYENFELTTWSLQNTAGDKSEIIGHSFYELESLPVISNLEPQYQLASDIDGYELIYSCYDPNKHPQTPGSSQQAYHIYFIYRPKTYTLTFMYEDGPITDTYYYTQSLEHALENHDDHDHSDPVKTGHEFKGWYPNEAGEGEKYDFNASPAPTMPNHSVVLYPRMDVIEYVVKIDPNGGVIDHINYSKPLEDHYGNYANQHGLLGTGYNKSQATYFNAKYGTPIGEYTVERNYIMLTDEELANGSFDETNSYYYLNAQFNENYDGDWGLPADLRNAVYLTKGQLEAYYDYYCDVVDDNIGYYTGVNKLPWDEFCAAYTSYPDHPYRPVGSENYAFMGWYQVFDDGSVDTMPYNFNNPTMGPITLRALWRLEGGYYICYNPVFVSDDRQTIINGEMATWMDPESIGSQKYSDQALTRVLRAPTNESLQGWIFRGWMVVEKKTEIISGTEYFVGEPIQLDANNSPVYYQPGEVFTIDSALAKDEDVTAKIIYLQAVYEPTTGSYRRPDVTNLIIDANADSNGYIKPGSIGSIPTLSGPGNQIVNPSVLFEEKPVQVLLGDFQSNIALHLFGYASVMEHKDGYLLLGFDENSDPTSPSTGYAYIPEFAADSVIAVTKNETGKTIYAMWEPMVYVTFVNDTDEDITIDLSGTGSSTVSVVNQVTGKFSREHKTASIVVPKKVGDTAGNIKVVFPGAVADTDSFTATAQNKQLGKKITVAGEFPVGTTYGDGEENKKYGTTVVYTGTLKTDADGIVVTYTAIPDEQVLFNVNGGTWTDDTTGNPFEVLTDGVLYGIGNTEIINNQYMPSNPIRNGKVFLGWTPNADIAAQTDFSSSHSETWGNTTIIPDSGSIVLDKIRSDYLWNFSLNPPYNQTLYAVWSDAVTVTFNIAYTKNLTTTPLNLHTWVGPALESPGDYVFYQSTSSDAYILYTVAKGDVVPQPSDPIAYSDNPTWNFVRWLNKNNTTDSCRYNSKDLSYANLTTDKYDFSQRVMTNCELVTSWTTAQPQVFEFTVLNNVIGGSPNDEFEYLISISKEKVDKSNKLVDVDTPWGSVSTSLKNGQTYTVRIEIYRIDAYGGSFGGTMSIFAEDGTVIKSEQLIRHSTLGNKYFTTSCSFTLDITQIEKNGYTKKGVVDHSASQSDPAYDFSYAFPLDESFRFVIQQGGKFDKQINVYATEGLNTLTIVFEHECKAVVAPTDFRDSKSPFLWLFAAGLVLFAVAIIYGRRKASVVE